MKRMRIENSMGLAAAFIVVHFAVKGFYDSELMGGAWDWPLAIVITAVLSALAYAITWGLTRFIVAKLGMRAS